MKDDTTTIAGIRQQIRDFSDARGWRKGERSRNFTLALSIEAEELSKIFDKMYSENIESSQDDPEKFGMLKDELADVFWYLCRICDRFDIDLTEAVESKAKKNAEKYPLED